FRRDPVWRIGLGSFRVQRERGREWGHYEPIFALASFGPYWCRVGPRAFLSRCRLEGHCVGRKWARTGASARIRDEPAVFFSRQEDVAFEGIPLPGCFLDPLRIGRL